MTLIDQNVISITIRDGVKLRKKSLKFSKKYKLDSLNSNYDQIVSNYITQIWIIALDRHLDVAVMSYNLSMSHTAHVYTRDAIL